ncbi:MAG TPA: extracellular solute-binding protein, partial [Anaerolineaceae bacterium]|nr:extracellular solute-binding protein [Anaerolineaceae bacterium]
KLMSMISVILVAVFVLAACAPAATPTPENVKITLWTKEGEVDGGLQYVQGLADAYTAAHPNVTFEVVNKEVETLREDFQTASLAGNSPDLLWTVSDHAGPFVAADLIQPVDGMVDLTAYVESVKMNGKTWAVPISSGNHLMLLYNKDLIATAPKDTDELLALAGTFGADIYPLVFNQTEPFWLAPFLGGFGGKVFAEDGVTPTLNTPEMVNTLAFMVEMKTKGIIPAEGDYNSADTLFKEGKAALIINGDWSLGGYQEALGDKLGVAPIPMIKATGKYPAPYTSGVYFMVPKSLSGAKLEAAKDFMKFVTNEANQLDMVAKLKRLPALKVALSNSVITSDPILANSAAQMAYGTPMPTVLEMRCNWDSMKPELQAVLAGTVSPADAAKNMQTSAEACIKKLE